MVMLFAMVLEDDEGGSARLKLGTYVATFFVNWSCVGERAATAGRGSCVATDSEGQLKSRQLSA